MTSSSRVASHNYANHIHPQENASAKMMRDISGRKCLDAFERFPRVGLWAKTFAALLIGMEGWYSTKCRLTWKLSATKSHRFYFQLVPSTLRTEGTECGLLPTVTSVQRDHPERVEALKATGAKTMMSRNCGESRPNSILDHMNFYGMLHTPTAMDSTGATANMKSTQVKEGSMHSVTLSRWAGMLPTPTKSDFNARGNQPNWKGDDLVTHIHCLTSQTGKYSHLSPQFVLEMMGFPTDWTELPFLNGETNQLKQEGTQ